MFPRYFRIALAQRVESTGMGGDRSINSPFTRYVNKFFFVKEWEKEKETKSRGDMGEGVEIGKMKIKEKWLWKQKEDEIKMS